METRIEYSIASQANKTIEQVEQYCRFFKAQAADELGKEMSVAVLAEGIGPKNGDRAAQIAVMSIVDYFRSHVTADVMGDLAQSLIEANSSIIAKQKEDPTLVGHGASVAIVVIAGDRIFLCGVGHGRAYLMREDEFRILTLDRNWVSEALQSWGAAPDDIQYYDATPNSYLGKDANVEPQFAPVDFFWEGDVVILMTASLAKLIRPSHVRDAVLADLLDDSAKRLVEIGLERGGKGNLTAIVIDAPGKVKLPSPVPTETGALRISNAAKMLIVGNILLIILIAAFLIQSGGVRGLLAPSPTVEVAKPMFAPTALGPDEAMVGPDEAPFASTPSPQAAPTLIPAPTFTPMPLPEGWKQPNAPIPRQPANGAVFGGLDATVVLGWDPISSLAQDMFYVVDIRKYVDGKLIGESRNWTRATRIRLDSSFLTAELSSPSHIGVAALSVAAKVEFRWSVSVYRLTQIQSDGILTGQSISPPSPTLTFVWTPQVQQAPTRIYGSQNLKTDPFFQAEQERQTSVEAKLGPVSAGMAGVWLLLGGLIAGPKLAHSRTRSHRRTRY